MGYYYLAIRQYQLCSDLNSVALKTHYSLLVCAAIDDTSEKRTQTNIIHKHRGFIVAQKSGHVLPVLIAHVCTTQTWDRTTYREWKHACAKVERQQKKLANVVKALRKAQEGTQ